MIESPLRLTTTWLTDPVDGVNAELPNVPRPGGESQPPDCVFFDELTTPWVARNMVARDALLIGGVHKPGIIIRFPELDDDAAVQQPVHPALLDQGGILVPIAVLYVRRKIQAQAAPASHAALVREGRQTMRTVVRVIAKRFPDLQSDYTVDDCKISMAPQGITMASRYVDVGDDEILDRCVIPFIVNDRWAMGVT